MKIKAICSFVGPVCMAKGEVKEVRDNLASDLILAGYARALDPGTRKKAVKQHENQSGHS